MLEDQVFDLILAEAQVTENKVPYEKVIQSEPARRKSGSAAA